MQDILWLFLKLYVIGGVAFLLMLAYKWVAVVWGMVRVDETGQEITEEEDMVEGYSLADFLCIVEYAIEQFATWPWKLWYLHEYQYDD